MPRDDHDSSEGPQGRAGNLISGLSVKKQLLHRIMFKQSIQFTSFLSYVSLEAVLLRRK